MAGLNMGIIREMPIPLVPIELQARFAKRIEALGCVKLAHGNGQAGLSALFASLQHRAFRGDR